MGDHDGTYNANPVTKRKIDMSGNVVRSNARRPNVSIVKMAGAAKIQLRAPKPRDAASADMVLKPDSSKMVAE